MKRYLSLIILSMTTHLGFAQVGSVANQVYDYDDPILHQRRVDTVYVQVPVNGQYVNMQPTANVTELQSPYDRLLDKRHIERVDREGLKATFIPKGIWMFGGDISFNEWNDENNNMLVLKNLDFKGHTFGISPCVGYFFRKNMAVGARFSYNRYYFNCGNLDLNLGEDLNIKLDHLYYLQHTMEGSLFYRTYTPIGRSKIFGIFNEMRLTYGYSKGKNTTGTGADLDGTFEKTHYAQIGFCPGVTCFITDFAAAEVSVGVMGFKYKWSESTTNQVEQGRSHTASGNFKVNLFSVNIGMIIYL